MKIYTTTFDFYKPWSGAIETFETIKYANMLDNLEFLINDLYPDGISFVQLNDLLWFDGDFILESLGLKEPEDKEV